MSNIQMTAAETLTVRLVRPNSGVSWGFRLQGGADFNTPLSIQSVTPNSVAERSGLRAGDGLLYINNINSDILTHDMAKQEIINSYNDISLTVQRGKVQVWKPKVTPMSELRPQELKQIKTATGDVITPVQKTSLARENRPEPLRIGSGHNRTARPFGQQGGPPKQAVPNVVHAQFNSPMQLYSAENIADTYAMQTAGIQKEMENLDVVSSPVGSKMTGTYQPLGDEDDDDAHARDDQIPDEQDSSVVTQSPEVEHETTNTTKHPSGFRSVKAPEAQSPSVVPQQQQQTMHCGNCGNMVTGVFVRVKGIPYHAQCFTCKSCGINLKQKDVSLTNQYWSYWGQVKVQPLSTGPYDIKMPSSYFMIEGNLYCEIHAKRVAQPPDPNMRAVPVYR